MGSCIRLFRRVCCRKNTKRALVAAFLPPLLLLVIHLSNRTHYNKVQKTLTELLKWRDLPRTSRWIIVNNSPNISMTEDLLRGLHDWTILFLLDAQSANMPSCENCIGMNTKEILSLGFKVTEVGGKQATMMGGYLYAIARGARVIYLSNGFSGPSDRLISRSSEKTVSGLRYGSGHYFNPYQHFGQPQLFTQNHLHTGLPSKKIQNVYYTFEWKTPLIMKEMVDGIHTVESRIDTSTKIQGDLNVSFDQHAPLVIVTEGTYTALASTNNIYLYDSFFTLFTPLGKTDVNSVTWQYWAQRLLWEVEGGVGFTACNETVRHKHVNVPPTPLKKLHIKSQIPRLTQLLKPWLCAPGVSLSVCIKHLTDLLVNKGFWPKQNLLLMDAWLSDLKSVGYQEPWRVVLGQYETKYQYGDVRATYFWPSLQPISDNKILKFKGYNVGENKTYARVMSICGKGTPPESIKNLPYEGKKIQDILLVIVFNFPLYVNIDLLEHLYARHFAHVLYCGESIGDFNRFKKYYNKPISYIESNHFRGFLGYDCVLQAMRMNYDVKGYLHIGDDVLLNVWSLYDLPRDKLWFQSSMRIASRSAPNVPDLHKAPGWGPWNSMPGKRTLIPLWELLENLSVDKDEGDYVVDFLKTLKNNTGSPQSIFYEASDIFYIASRFTERYMYFSRLFFKQGVFLEIAVPTILNGIEQSKDIYRLKGHYLWYNQRKKYSSKFNEANHFLHAWKLKKELKKSRGVVFFCDVLLPRINLDLVQQGTS